MSDNYHPCSLTVQPWYRDHAIGGKAVLPAVETMLLLAGACRRLHPEREIRVMEDVRFGKFLDIPSETSTIATLVQCVEDDDGRIRAKLLSRTRLTAMARIKEHGEIVFGKAAACSPSPPRIDATRPGGRIRVIECEHVYRQLVPFGPHYRTLTGSLHLADGLAWGELRAPELPFVDPVQIVLGSPFPLDGAMHAACVLGQQEVDFAPFPVGFARRRIFRPTQAGCSYTTRVELISLGSGELVFDLIIFDRNGHLYESVTGLRMRDVRRAITHDSPAP